MYNKSSFRSKVFSAFQIPSSQSIIAAYGFGFSDRLVKNTNTNIYNSLHRFLVSLELIYKIFALADYSGVEIKHGLKFLASYKSFRVLRSKISNGNVPIFNWRIASNGVVYDYRRGKAPNLVNKNRIENPRGFS